MAIDWVTRFWIRSVITQCWGLGVAGIVLLDARADSAHRSAEIWPQWRGPQRTGQVQGQPWPDRLSGGAVKLLWRMELGPGYSGPIVTADRVFVTETHEKRLERVQALDRQTGKAVWQAEWEGAMSVPFFAKSNGDWIRATPTHDGESLFVAGMRDLLVCLDATTGKERWRVDFTKRFDAPLPAFGFVSSPLVDGDAVYVQAGASVVKLDKRTGKALWRAVRDDGGMWGSAFSSPMIETLAGQRQLMVQTREKLAGLDLASGKVLWSQPVAAFRGMNILTPVVFEDHLFTSTYGGKTIAFKVTRSGDQFSVREAWAHKAQGNMSTPVIVGHHAYHHLRNQRFMCFDLRTGEEKWMTSQGFGKYWSLVANRDRILALDERGVLYLLRANPEKFESMDSLKVSEADTWAHLAVSGDTLVIRDLGGVTAYHWKTSVE